MKIYLGADHGGFALKQDFKEYLSTNSLEFVDCGALTYDPNDDYPLFAFQVAQKMLADTNLDNLGVLFCRSGSGMVIAANKVPGIRAVEIYDQEIAKHAKSHNHANVIAFSGEQLSINEMQSFFEIFLHTALDESDRHLRRIKQISNYEGLLKLSKKEL